MALHKEPYGLIYNDDGSLCVTLRKDDTPFDGVHAFAVEEGTTNIVVSQWGDVVYNDKPTSYSSSNQPAYWQHGSGTWYKLLYVTTQEITLNPGDTVTISGWLKYKEGTYDYPILY